MIPIASDTISRKDHLPANPARPFGRAAKETTAENFALQVIASIQIPEQATQVYRSNRRPAPPIAPGMHKLRGSAWNPCNKIYHPESGGCQFVFRLHDRCNFLQKPTLKERYNCHLSFRGNQSHYFPNTEAFDWLIPLMGEEGTEKAFEAQLFKKYRSYDALLADHPNGNLNYNISIKDKVSKITKLCATLRQLGYDLNLRKNGVFLTLPDLTMLKHRWEALREQNPNLPPLLFENRTGKESDIEMIKRRVIDGVDAFVSQGLSFQPIGSGESTEKYSLFVHDHLFDVSNAIEKALDATIMPSGYYGKTMSHLRGKVEPYYDFLFNAETAISKIDNRQELENHLRTAAKALNSWLKFTLRNGTTIKLWEVSKKTIREDLFSPTNKPLVTAIRSTNKDIFKAWEAIEAFILSNPIMK